MLKALFDRPAAPLFVFRFLGGAIALELLGNGQQGVGGIRVAVEDHVLDAVAQFGGDLIIDFQLTGVDDTHGQAAANGVIEEDRVNGLAHRVVAAERERHVGHTTRAQRVGQVVTDIGAGVDEINRVVVVLLNAGGDGKDVGVEDDVFRRKADFVDQNVVGAFADLVLARLGVGLTRFIKGHDDDRSAVALAQAGVLLELLDAFFHGDRVDDALALDAFQAGFDDRPLRAVDHDRHARNVRLRGDQVEEPRHRRLGVEHAFVHVHIDNLRSVLDLLPGNNQRFLVLVVLDQLGKARRAGDVGALADVDEIGLGSNGQRLHAAESQPRLRLGQAPWLAIRNRLGNLPDMPRRGAATAADDV